MDESNVLSLQEPFFVCSRYAGSRKLFRVNKLVNVNIFRENKKNVRPSSPRTGGSNKVKLHKKKAFPQSGSGNEPNGRCGVTCMTIQCLRL